MSVIQRWIYDEPDSGIRSGQRTRQAVILVVEDGIAWSSALQGLCDFLEIVVERVSSHMDLAPVLDEQRPMAVLAGLEGAGQDGCHVLKTVAGHDRSLPVLLLTADDAALAGAADAVEQLWGLSEVVKRPALPPAGELVEFLFQAGLKGRCLGLVPA
jgi:DNA-binding NtrC family response regulator